MFFVKNADIRIFITYCDVTKTSLKQPFGQNGGTETCSGLPFHSPDEGYDLVQETRSSGASLCRGPSQGSFVSGINLLITVSNTTSVRRTVQIQNQEHKHAWNHCRSMPRCPTASKRKESSNVVQGRILSKSNVFRSLPAKSCDSCHDVTCIGWHRARLF
jgi:hypothetical protein